MGAIAKYYSPLEEKLNIFSHGIGLLLSVVALVFLIRHAATFDGVLPIVSFTIYGAALVLLYGASTFYHSVKEAVLRAKLRVIDHAMICVFIAGTYTPLTLITLQGVVGWTVFTCAWLLATAGVILSIFFTGRFKIISTLIYVFMGWMIVFAIKPLIASLDAAGLQWLVWGGVSYTVGAVIYAVKAIKFNHAMFHCFVLVGSFCHFMTIYWYVLPH